MTIYPKAYLKSVKDITPEFLKENNLNALILDVDNTLIDCNKNLSEEIIDWIKYLKEQKIKLYILSNTNDKQKVEKVAKTLDIPYRNLAKKPFKSGFLKVQKILNEKPENIGAVGDQIFTDVIGANRCKMFSILVDPIDKKDYWYTAWKRPLENFLKRKFVN